MIHSRQPTSDPTPGGIHAESQAWDHLFNYSFKLQGQTYGIHFKYSFHIRDSNIQTSDAMFHIINLTSLDPIYESTCYCIHMRSSQ